MKHPTHIPDVCPSDLQDLRHLYFYRTSLLDEHGIYPNKTSDLPPQFLCYPLQLFCQQLVL